MRDFREQARGISFGNVTCDRDRRKKTKEKVLKVLTIRSVNSPSELGLINLTTKTTTNLVLVLMCQKEVIQMGNTISGEVIEMEPKTEIESYASM